MLFFVSLFLILALLLTLAYIYLRRVWFYRDPLRRPEANGRVIIAPCDGKVVYLKRVEKGEIKSEKKGDVIKIKEVTKADFGNAETGWLIGIYMSPLDVHYNYAPIEGKVEKIVYYPAKTNLPMVDLWEYINLTYFRRAVNLFSHRFHFENERNTIFINKEGEIRVAAVEIADRFVSKISCFVKEGDFLRLGQKISFIDRGSQVDLVIFKGDLNWRVKFGDQVYGGKTVLAEY